MDVLIFSYIVGPDGPAVGGRQWSRGRHGHARQGAGRHRGTRQGKGIELDSSQS